MITAYIPCYNDAKTLTQAIESIRRQTVAVDEIFVVDDGSSDGSGKVAQDLGVRVIRHEKNLGRGAARARAMLEAKHDLVLSCDATNVLKEDFVERALLWFENPLVAAVFGRLVSVGSKTAAQRWRARHLLKEHLSLSRDHHASFSTWGAMVRRSFVVKTGNFNPAFYHSEDKDLGERLLAAGYEVILDPKLSVVTVARENAWEVLERYWRWYAGREQKVNFRWYAKQIIYSLKVMAVQDIRAGDFASVPMSLLAPHVQFFRSLFRKK
jgi:glycosyltransferase involved in cell wall biosynthesis